MALLATRTAPPTIAPRRWAILAAFRAGQFSADADREVLDAGHVEVLRHLHDRLDAAVAAAYGWPLNLSADAIVERVTALNRKRCSGGSRWPGALAALRLP